MNKEERKRRLKAIIDTQKIISLAQDAKRYIVEVPGYSLRGSTRSASPHEAINHLIQRWVKSGDLISENISEPIRVKLTDFSTKNSSEFMISVDEAMSGSTSYQIPDFGGYDESVDTEKEEDVLEGAPSEISTEEGIARDKATDILDGIEIIEPTFNESKILITDHTMRFNPDDINSLIYRSKNKAWISIPDFSRKNSIPNLYELVGDPTSHEKYFGVKTKYGYIPTIASSILLHLATKGGANRGDLKELQKLRVPKDYPLSGQVSEYLLTLPPSVEEAAIRESFSILQEAHQKPSLLRRLMYKPGTDNFEYTTSHSRGVRETAPQAPLTPEMKERMKVLNRGLSKPIGDYRRLNILVEEFVEKLDARMTVLLKEQHSINSSSRFLKPSGKRDDVDDVLRNIILRKIISAVQGSEAFKKDSEGDTLTSPLESAEFQEADYSSPA
jgi:hypothetical protein